MSSVGNGRVPILGRAFISNTSQMLDARLYTQSVTSGYEAKESANLQVVTEDGTPVVTAELKDVTIDPRLGSMARRITFPDGTMFETDDHDAINRLTGKDVWNSVHSYEKFHPRLAAFVVVLVAVGWIFWRYGLDIMASVAVAMTPAVLVDQIDNGTLKTIEFTMADETQLTEDQRAAAKVIFDKLVAQLDEDEQRKHDFQLYFYSMPSVGPNAFALPGGSVVITDQFAEQFPNDDILAGVIGHELGHVVEQHGLRQMYRSLGVYIIIALMAGDTGPILEDILLEGNLLLSLSYSRGHESSADEFGLKLSKDAGFDPAGLKLFFEELSKMGGEPPEWLSTHPSSADRVEAIDDYLKNLD